MFRRLFDRTVMGVNKKRFYSLRGLNYSFIYLLLALVLVREIIKLKEPKPLLVGNIEFEMSSLKFFQFKNVRLKSFWYSKYGIL